MQILNKNFAAKYVTHNSLTNADKLKDKKGEIMISL